MGKAIVILLKNFSPAQRQRGRGGAYEVKISNVRNALSISLRIFYRYR